MIWSLLALDHHIIADCEVVEGMVRVGTFAPCTDRYARNCYNRLVGDFDADYVKMCCLLANIYVQQRKNSPIQVVQRAIRSQKTQRPPRLPEPTQPPEDTNWARDEPLDTQNPAASPDPLNMQEPTVKIEVDRQKLVNQVHATFQGFESHPRSEYLDWVKLNVLDSHHRGDRTTRKEAKPLSAKGAPLRMPSFESTADNRRRPSCRSLPPPVSLEHSQDKTAGPAAPPVQKADLARIQSDVERPLSSRDVSRGPMEKSNFLRPLITAESQRGRAARERAGQARQKRRAMAVRRDVERAATVVIDHKTAVYLAAMTERRKDEDVIRQHAQAVRAAEEQLRTDHAAWRQYELQRHADLDKERTLLRAQLTALAKKEKTELVTQFRQQLSQTQRAKTCDFYPSCPKQCTFSQSDSAPRFLAKTQREALERMRREVHAALREKRQQNVHQNTMEANQLQQMRAKLTTADAQQRKALASKTKAAKLPPGAAREAVTHSAKSRDHPYLQGLPAVPARPAVVAHQTPMTLYAEPGVGAQIKAGPLAAEAYPQSMWPTMPTHMLIDARLRELEGRWQSIGDFCQLEKCRLNPVHACGDCFPKFRAFVTVEITDAISGAAAAAAVTSS